MVDEFCADNGATPFVPGTHHGTSVTESVMADRSADYDAQALACGRAGSLIIFNGSSWHSYTANTSDEPRRSLQGAFIPRRAQRVHSERGILRRHYAHRCIHAIGDSVMQSRSSLSEDITRHLSVAVLELLSDEALADWFRRTILASVVSSRFTMRRLTWRRAPRHAARAFRDACAATLEPPRDLCGSRPPISHGATGDHVEWRFTRYCRDCAASAPHDYFSMTA